VYAQRAVRAGAGDADKGTVGDRGPEGGLKAAVDAVLRESVRSQEQESELRQRRAGDKR